MQVNSVVPPSIGATAFRHHDNCNDSIFSVETYTPMERSHGDLSHATLQMFVTCFLKYLCPMDGPVNSPVGAV